MSIPQSLRDMHPYWRLVVAALAAVVLVQIIAMVVVTRSQVLKAEAHYAQERAQLAAARAERNARVAQRSAATDGVINVGYVVSR